MEYLYIWWWWWILENITGPNKPLLFSGFFSFFSFSHSYYFSCGLSNTKKSQEHLQYIYYFFHFLSLKKLISGYFFELLQHRLIVKTVLAAWMRLKYPHVAIGALASSAPILQFEDITSPESFYDIVSSDFKVWTFILKL